MITGLIPTLLIIFIFCIVLSIQVIRQKIVGIRFIYWIIFGIYIALLINVTFFPFPIQKMLIEISIQDHLGSSHNIIPLHDFWLGIQEGTIVIALKQLFKNTLLFIPLGLILPVLLSKNAFKSVVLIGFVISLLVEVLQWLLGQFLGYNYRSFDVDDLIMNTIGTAIGFIIFKLGRGLLVKRQRAVNTL